MSILANANLFPYWIYPNDSRNFTFRINNTGTDPIRCIKIHYPEFLNYDPQYGYQKDGDWNLSLDTDNRIMTFITGELAPGETLDLHVVLNTIGLDPDHGYAEADVPILVSGSIDGSDPVAATETKGDLGRLHMTATEFTEGTVIPKYDDVEEIVIKWLNETYKGVYPASGNKPNPMPPVFITVDRTGGPREAMVLDRAEILIEVYSKKSRLEAKNVANSIADRITELLNYADDITHASINSVVNLDDTVAQYNRYQVYCDISHRRRV